VRGFNYTKKVPSIQNILEKWQISTTCKFFKKCPNTSKKSHAYLVCVKNILNSFFEMSLESELNAKCDRTDRRMDRRTDWGTEWQMDMINILYAPAIFMAGHGNCMYIFWRQIAKICTQPEKKYSHGIWNVGVDWHDQVGLHKVHRNVRGHWTVLRKSTSLSHFAINNAPTQN
jgi:hypothetical protein